MDARKIGWALLSGVILVPPVIAIMFLADRMLDLSFPPFDTFDWVARELPGPLVTFGIDTMIALLLAFGLSVSDSAKTAEQIMAIVGFLLAGVIATAIVYALVQWRGPQLRVHWGLLIGIAVGLPVALITVNISPSSVNVAFILAWTLALFAAWGSAAVWVARRLILARSDVYQSEDGERSVVVFGRRRFLVYMGATAATVTVAGAGLGQLLSIGEGQPAVTDATMPGYAGMDELPNADDPVKPALGTRPEYTAVRDHYKIFLRSEPTIIDGAAWTLPITGMVRAPAVLTLPDLMSNYEPKSQFITLSCISNSVGGDLISTTYWTGASLQEILQDVQPTSEARYLDITCGDGFHETVALDLIASDPRIMLAYAWDGRPIPQDHGFPLRIWIPDRYGMKQPKWITGIEVVGEAREGYWVSRGWDEVARVRTTSVVDTVGIDSVHAQGEERLVPIGGIAYAGARGISKVEVQIDDQGPWREAALRTPLSDTTWVIWRYNWAFEPGRHTVRVRAIEGDGTPQIEDVNSPRPSGATGLHHKEVSL